MSSKLQKIIQDKYFDHAEIIKLIKKYRLEQIINKSIQTVESRLENHDFDNIPNISGILLTNVNSLVGQITESSDKIKIKYVLGDLFQDYLNIISSQKEGKAILQKIQENLITACEIGNHDYSDLIKYLGLEKSKILIPNLNPNLIYYEWYGKDYELDELSKDLYDMKIIYSVKEFKKLFKPITKNLIVRCNPEKRDILFVLFQLLKDQELIKPQGISGHFAPIVRYCMDNEESFLFKKAANKFHDILKRKKDKYLKIKDLVLNIINNNINMF